MKHTFGLGLGLALLMSAPAFAAVPPPVDVTGTWSLAGEVEGVTVTETCVLTQTPDGKITGTCDTMNGKLDTTGAVTDQTVILQHGGEYQGTKLTLTYTGKLGSDGLITGVLDVDPLAVTGSFTAKKSVPTA